MDEQEPRIVARGEWAQDEYGDILYTPAGHRPVFADDADLAPAESDGDDPADTDDAPWPDAISAGPFPKAPWPDAPWPDAAFAAGLPADRRGHRKGSDAVWTVRGATIWREKRPSRSATVTACASAR